MDPWLLLSWVLPFLGTFRLRDAVGSESVAEVCSCFFFARDLGSRDGKSNREFWMILFRAKAIFASSTFYLENYFQQLIARILIRATFLIHNIASDGK